MAKASLPKSNSKIKNCSVEECASTIVSRGMCGKHYRRWYAEQRKDGNLAKGVDPEILFWRKVEKTPTCWIWKGGLARKNKAGGYGQFNVNKKGVMAHRYSFFLANGYWPEPMCLHSCPGGDNPLCVNPDHLRAGTGQDNMQDCMERGRQTPGLSAILTVGDVRLIRELASQGLSDKEIYECVGKPVKLTTIRDARLKRSWKHV